MALVSAVSGAARRAAAGAMARVLPPAACAALPQPSAAFTALGGSRRASSAATAEGVPAAGYPRFQSLDDMAAWDLPAEGTFASGRAERQTLKQVYPSRPMTKHEQSLFVTEAGRAELPQLKDHGFRFLTGADALEGRPEAVKRALSTFTASIPELRTFRKSELVRKFRTHAYDTGSARVQVAILTERVEALQKHVETNNHDKTSKRCLQMLVHQRRKMLQYLMRSDFSGYRILLREMGLRSLPTMPVRYTSTRGQTDAHKAIRAKHSRQKKRTSRGHKGH